ALDDLALARRALELMGSSAVGSSGSCSTCHTLGRPTLTQWQQLTKSFADDCLADATLPDVTAVDAMYDCFERHGGSGFQTSDYGIYAAASHLPWFSFVLENASANADDPSGHDTAFVARVGMPRAGQRWTQDEFDVVAQWFARGAPSLFDLVPEDSGQSCQAQIDPALISHVSSMAAQGWRARAAEQSMLMFGCGSHQTGAECLQSFPTAASRAYGEGWDVVPGTTIRVLWDNTGSPTVYWSRSSPDGRYIASGLVQKNASDYFGQIVDLERDVVIDANFSYDPTFFPDGSGFMLQQGGSSSSATPGHPTNGSADAGDVAVTCGMSVLGDDPASIAGDEAECSSIESQIGLYQQLATSLNGEDYWVLFGAYDGDSGGFRPVYENPPAAFASTSTATLVPMVNQGGSFSAGSPIELSTPLQGDPMLSPSGKLLVTRVKGPEETRDIGGISVVTAAQSGYAIHLLSMNQTGSDWSASTSEVAQLCITGAKPVISFDERWMVIHHYVTDADATELGFSSASDPGFAAYRELGASNLYLVDLSNGDSRRITNMSAGQYALYPHFRADNWIYFVVRTTDTEEYFAASDAALIAE
ncbi:MAG TPA: hypothetical protein VMG12_16980, partial [Polyangiaceae bacterium]|nr:hypothetical protein [Polyangiaceae bacterium]